MKNIEEVEEGGGARKGGEIEKKKERSRESRVFRYYGIKHGPRDASPAATARSGDHDHNDDYGHHVVGQHVVDHNDATWHE